MRTPVAYVACLLALALAAGPAWAQDEEGGFGLDLSDDTTSPAPAEGPTPTEGADPGGGMGLGLDLSGGAPVGVDLQPRFVLLGLDTPDRAGAAVAKRWLGWLQGVALRTGRVAKAADAAEAQQTLESEYEAALRCAESGCLAGPADILDTDLLTTARLAQEDGTWTLRLWTYDRDRGVVEEDVVTGRKPNDSRFIREAGSVLASRVEALARPRAFLKVSSNVPQAVVRVGSRMLGVGNVERKVAPGEVQLFVEADEYEPFTRTLTLAPGETQEVAARLEMSGPAPEGPPVEAVAVRKRKSDASSGPSLLSRPAVYTALVGLVAVGAGVALGQGVSSFSGRVTDANSDGVLDVTRREYIAAQRQGMLSTALMAGGGALASGSVLWLILVPTRAEPSSTSVAPSAAGVGRGGAGLNLVFGGSF